MKKENTICKPLKKKVVIAGKEIIEIFFDLKHINYGWDKEKRDYKNETPRSYYTEDDIIALFEQLNTLISVPTAQRARKKSVEHRYVFYIYDENKKLTMVVDLMKNQTTVIVTLY